MKKNHRSGPTVEQMMPGEFRGDGWTAAPQPCGLGRRFPEPASPVHQAQTNGLRVSAKLIFGCSSGPSDRGQARQQAPSGWTVAPGAHRRAQFGATARRGGL